MKISEEKFKPRYIVSEQQLTFIHLKKKKSKCLLCNFLNKPSMIDADANSMSIRP